MKVKRIFASLLTFILLLTLIPTISARADELADGQIIANGIYYIQSVYSNYYMQVTEGLTLNNTYVSHENKYIEGVTDERFELGIDYDIRYMWNIQYVGEGKYTIYSMNQLNMQLNLANFDWSFEPIAVASYNTSTPNLDGTPGDVLWSIMQDDNGYVIMQDGDITKTLFAQNINRSVQPTIVAAEYDANVDQCHWNFVETPPNIMLYSSNGYYCSGSAYTILPEETIAYDECGLQIKTTINGFDDFNFTSTNESIAIINSWGLITGIAYGQTEIVVSFDYNNETIATSFFINVSPFAEGTYYIRNKETGQYLDSLTQNAVQGGTVALYNHNRNVTQQWVLESHGGLRYSIRQASGELYLGNNAYYSATPGSPVVLRNGPDSTTDQALYDGQFMTNIWGLELQPGGGYTIFADGGTSYCAITQCSSLENTLDSIEHRIYTEDDDYSDEWEFIRTYPVNVQVYYDNYVSAYADDQHDGVTNIRLQLNTLKTFYWENFAISINISEFRHRTTYLDYCRTLQETGVCQCRPCQDNNSPYNYPEGHHTNIWNILYHLPLPEAPIDATIQYIGHETCVADGNCTLGTQNGVYDNIYGLIVINNIARGNSSYNQADCTRTLIHEVGHLFKAPDHYGGNYPTTNKINKDTDYNGQFSQYCIYGEKRFEVAQSLAICDGCHAEILKNRKRYESKL